MFQGALTIFLAFLQHLGDVQITFWDELLSLSVLVIYLHQHRCLFLGNGKRNLRKSVSVQPYPLISVKSNLVPDHPRSGVDRLLNQF